MSVIMNIIGRRNWALRLSIILNICVLLYVCVHFRSSGPWIDDELSNWESQSISQLQLIGNNFQVNITQRSTGIFPENIKTQIIKTTNDTKQQHRLTNIKTFNDTQEKKNDLNRVDDLHNIKPSTQLDRKNSTVKPSIIPRTLKEAIPCYNKLLMPRTAQRGDYWVLYNYVPMNKSIQCWESVTYTTHADFTFLDNLEPLLKRWQAPISIALHAPGRDFNKTLDSIRYLRKCGSPLITEFVTFHIYFGSKHMPKPVPSSEKFLLTNAYNCSLGAPWANNNTKTYKSEKKLLYPVNVGRNIARELAVTHYVLASDIELYPNPNLSSKFLEMIRRNDQPQLKKPNPRVFVLPIFEIKKDSQPPQNKTILVKMLRNGTAITFHKNLCPFCHNIPKSKEWQQAPETNDLHVFHVGKRTGAFMHWEPIFIGTNNDPMYDERLSWEGKRDKMTQGYIFCSLDYDFLILDNAFLVHRPGIKYLEKDSLRQTVTAKTNYLIKNTITPELIAIYGWKKSCAI